MLNCFEKRNVNFPIKYENILVLFTGVDWKRDLSVDLALLLLFCLHHSATRPSLVMSNKGAPKWVRYDRNSKMSKRGGRNLFSLFQDLLQAGIRGGNEFGYHGEFYRHKIEKCKNL